jgi:hypothetical protein
MAINLDSGNAQDCVKFEVVKNAALTKTRGTTQWCPRTVAPCLSLRQIATQMQLQGSKYSVAEISGILDHFSEVCIQSLAAGHAVSVGGLFKLRPAVTGAFENIDSPFDPATNKVTVRGCVGAELKNAIADAKVQRVTNVAMPKFSIVYSGQSGEPNKLANEGDLIILGSRFIYDESDPQQGFFTNVEGTRIRAEVYKLDAKGSNAFVHSNQAMFEGDSATLTFVTKINDDYAAFEYPHKLTFEAPVNV